MRNKSENEENKSSETRITGGDTRKASVKCPNCGATLEVDPEQKTVECPYCDSVLQVDQLLGKNIDAETEREKTRAYRDVELGKQKIESDRLQLEAERMQMEKEQHEENKIKEKKKAFRKSKFHGFLIFLMVCAAFNILLAYTNGKTISMILSAVTLGLFVLTDLMGSQTIKCPGKMYLIPGILGIVAWLMFLPAMNREDAIQEARQEKEKQVAISWDELVLGDKIPEIESAEGEIDFNENDYLVLDIAEYSAKDYSNYIEECKDFGYTVDPEDTGSLYSAYNPDGYKLIVSYYNDDETMDLTLNVPEELGTISWPETGAGALVPVPSSTTGKISTDTSENFYAIVGNTTIDDYSTYAEACSNEGFNVNYDKGENYYNADDSAGDHISLKYIGFNQMTVEVKAAENKAAADTSVGTEAETSAEAAADTGTTTDTNAAETSANTAASSESGQPNTQGSSQSSVVDGAVTPEFKASMDAYEKMIDDYVAFMQKYEDSDNSAAMLADYYKYLSDYEDAMNKLDEVDEDSLSPADDAYYIEVMARIDKKLLTVAADTSE